MIPKCYEEFNTHKTTPYHKARSKTIRQLKGKQLDVEIQYRNKFRQDLIQKYHKHQNSIQINAITSQIKASLPPPR